jgi:hypothetical protein
MASNSSPASSNDLANALPPLSSLPSFPSSGGIGRSPGRLDLDASASSQLRALAQRSQTPPRAWYVVLSEDVRRVALVTFVSAAVLLLVLRPQFVMTRDAQGKYHVSLIKVIAWSLGAAGLAYVLPMLFSPSAPSRSPAAAGLGTLTGGNLFRGSRK